MDARTEMYRDIKVAVEANVPEIEHIGLWNQDTYYMEESVPWSRPALFVEFGIITWDAVTKERPLTLRGSGELKLHVVVDWNDDTSYEQAFHLCEKTVAAMMGIGDEDARYSVKYPSQTLTNHNHEGVLEHVDVMAVRYWREIE